MPQNKVHQAIEDGNDFPYMNTQHVTRVGLLLSTMAVSETPAIVMDRNDVHNLVEHANNMKTNKDSLREALGNFVLQFPANGFTVLLLVVPRVDENTVEFYPFSDNNEEGKMWPYDKHFTVTGYDGDEAQIHQRGTHPLADVEVLGKDAMEHMSALTYVALAFTNALQRGFIELVKEPTDYTKINRKRAKNGRTLLKPDYKLEWK